MINGVKKVEGYSMRSVYVQSRSLVGRGLYEREGWRGMLAVDSVCMGSIDGTKVGAGHVRQEHSMHEFTSPLYFPSAFTLFP